MTAVSSSSSSSVVSSIHVQPSTGDNNRLAVVMDFCKRAMAGIRPGLIKNPAVAAFALRSKADMYELDRLRKVRANLPTSPAVVIMRVSSFDHNDNLEFDLRVSNPSNRLVLLPAGTVTITFQQMLEFSGFPTVKA